MTLTQTDTEIQRTPVCIRCQSSSSVTPYMVVHKEEPQAFYRCQSCRLVFEDPVPYDSQQFDLGKEAEELTEQDNRNFHKVFGEVIDITDSEGNPYPEFDYSAPDQMIRELFEAVDDHISRYLPERRPLRVLEIGCATGYLLREIQKQYPGSEVQGVEPSPISCKKARQQGTPVSQGTLETVNLEGQRFDVIICIGNLMLHPNPIETLRRSRDLLAEEGILIFDAKNLRSSHRVMAKCFEGTPLVNALRSIRQVIYLSYSNMRFAFCKSVLKSVAKQLDLEVLYCGTKPMRFLRCQNKHPRSRGLSGMALRVLDFVDRCRHERAWIEMCCRRKPN